MTETTASDVLRSDYGGFNPRFIGLSYLFDSADDYNMVHEYMTESEQLSKTGNADATLHRIALLSVVDHENRHYVDFLLSPYSMMVFRMRLQGLINAIQALNVIRGIEGDVLPVPLSRWATLTKSQRETRRADWSDLFGRDIRPVSLPAWSRDDLVTNVAPTVESIAHLPDQREFERYAEAAIRAYLRIGQLTEGFDVPETALYLRPPYVHEVSALTVQLAAVWVGQGLAEFLRLSSFLLDSEAPQARAFQLCFKLASLLEHETGGSGLDQSLLLPLRRILTITTWALFGNYQLDGARGCPSSRLIRLLDAVTEEPDDARLSCDLDDEASIERMWHHWDERIGATPWGKSLAHNLAITSRGASQYLRLRDIWQGSTDILDAVIGVLHQVEEHQQIIARTFVQDLRPIVDPFRYVRIPDSDLPRPDVRFEFRGFGAKPDWVRSGRMIQRRTSDGTPYAAGVAFAVRGDGGAWALLDQKLTLEEQIEWCDVAFSELSVPDHVYPSARRGVEDLSGKRLVQLV